MGVLIATVGSLGLMETMSTNVLERTREIGVMRSIGASNGAVQWIVIFEGVLISHRRLYLVIIVTVLAAVASFFPSWNVSWQTVREVLAYE